MQLSLVNNTIQESLDWIQEEYKIYDLLLCPEGGTGDSAWSRERMHVCLGMAEAGVWWNGGRRKKEKKME